MDAIVRTAPPPGSANPGDLYVDLQSRTLWLGVDTAVEEEGFTLISDIVAFEANVEGCLVDANAYTDTQILTRAPTVHTHTAAQITDFTAAVQAVMAATPGSSINRGLIAMFSGSLAEIGVGDWAGWALCDGTNGTPNLRDKFIMGAGNSAVGAVNPSASLTTTGGGTHIHTVNGTAISVAQMPSHSHGAWTGTENQSHTHSAGTLVTDTEPAHSHNYTRGDPGNGSSGAGSYTGAAETVATTPAGAHSHDVSGNTGGINNNHQHSINAEGSGQTHTHTLVGGGGIHEHSVSSGQIRDTIPYYALAFVMKL
jgi:hypothetical protein